MLKLVESLPNAFEGRRVTVRRDKVETLNGKQFTYEVVQVSNAVAILPVLPNGDVILVRNYRHPTGETFLEVPAGKLEIGETDALQRAKDELREEAGYTADNWINYGEVYSSPGIMTEKIILFKADGLKPCERELEDSEIGMTVETLTTGQISVMMRKREIKDQKTLLLLTQYLFQEMMK